LKTLSQEEKVCRKIVIMEERWEKFQAAKKNPKTKNKASRVLYGSLSF